VIRKRKKDSGKGANSKWQIWEEQGGQYSIRARAPETTGKEILGSMYDCVSDFVAMFHFDPGRRATGTQWLPICSPSLATIPGCGKRRR